MSPLRCRHLGSVTQEHGSTWRGHCWRVPAANSDPNRSQAGDSDAAHRRKQAEVEKTHGN